MVISQSAVHFSISKTKRICQRNVWFVIKKLNWLGQRKENSGMTIKKRLQGWIILQMMALVFLVSRHSIKTIRNDTIDLLLRLKD
jgi:hypothetical protein